MVLDPNYIDDIRIMDVGRHLYTAIQNDLQSLNLFANQNEDCIWGFKGTLKDTLTKLMAVDHFTDCGVLQKGNFARFQQASECTFESRVWITTCTSATGDFSNTKSTQPKIEKKSIFGNFGVYFTYITTLNSLVRIITDRIVFVIQCVCRTRFTKKVDGVFHMIIAIDDFHAAFLLKLQKN